MTAAGHGRAIAAAALLLLATAAVVAFGDLAPVAPEPPRAMGGADGATTERSAIDAPAVAGDRERVATPAQPSTDAPRGGALRVTVVRGAGRHPLAGVPIQVRTVDGPVPLARALTGGDGSARIDALAPGLYVVQATADDARIATLGDAAREVEVVFELPEYADLVGDVVDARGLPVAGARILVADARLGEAARLAAVTDSSGAFRALLHTPLPTVWAEADGRVRSAVLQPECFAGPPVRLELVVGDRGATLQGVVRDADGRPVAGARLEIQDVRPEPGAGAPPAVGVPGCIVIHTDQDGRFACSGLGAGLARWRLRLDRRVVEAGMVDLEADATREVEITLPRLARVEGRVIGPDGRPCAGVTVRAGEGSRGGARSDADGRFTFDDLRPGAIALLAADPGHGRGRADVTLEAGVLAVAELRLDPRGTLAGRVLGADGAPRAGLWVTAELDVTEPPLEVVTAADGGFRIVGCDRPARRLTVATAAGAAPLGEWRDLTPDHSDLELRIDDRPGARIVGRVLRPAGFETDAVQLRIERSPPGGFALRIGAATDGTFATAPLPPARYTVAVVPWASALTHPDAFTAAIVAGGPDVDLGDIALPVPTALRLDPSLATGGPRPRSLDVVLTRLDSRATEQHLRWRGDRFVDVPWLTPGRWRVDVRPGLDHLATSAEVEILPGRVAVLPLALPGARRCRVEVERRGRGLPLHVSGRAVGDGVVREFGVHDGVGWVGLGVGRYRVEVEGVGETELLVTSPTGPPLPVRL